MRLAADLKNLDGLTQMDLAGSIVGKSTRWLAAVNTQYNPAFGLANLTRDTWGGLVNLNSTPLRGRGLKVLKDVPMAGDAGHHARAGHQRVNRALRVGQAVGQFQDDGGRTGWRELLPGSERARAGDREGAARTPSTTRAGPRVLVTRTLRLLDGFNMVLENAVRLAAYKEALDKGMSRPEAARLGASSRWTSTARAAAPASCRRCTPSSTPACRAARARWKPSRGRTARLIIAGGLTLGVIQALMLLWADYDEDEIPDFVKARSLIIPLPRNAEGEKRFMACRTRWA
jgi:hypothetical protein